MRGADLYKESLFTAIKLEDFVPASHLLRPIRPIRTWVNEALAKMDTSISAMHEADARGGHPPENRARETHADHAAAGARGKWREKAPGIEWFDTTLAEIKDIVKFVNA